jgi:FeS assembly SUF system protein
MSDETSTATTDAPATPAPAAEAATDAGTLSATAADSLSATAHGDGASLQDKVVEALTTVFDPEIPVNIYELGLVYDVDVAQDGEVTITMTLTTPNCPVAGSLPGEVQDKVAAVEGVKKAHVNLVWEPAWTPERMSEAAKLELGWL